MIAKHVPMRTVRKSNFAELVDYITGTQNNRERVGYVAVTHCHQENARDAALEIQATQALNKRTESDKTYHLIISFQAGENPAPEVLRVIEARLCEGLGYREHQRVSVVHHDTDNLHIHIAINKIHPIRLTIHEPYNDYKMLGQLCAQLEGEYGLQHDNHQARKRGAENRAVDMERRAGIESLIGWIQRTCLESIQSAKTWKELHQVMRTNGLEIRQHGNGLVISNQAGTMVKASSVARNLSKRKLEARLGSFETSSEHQVQEQPVRQYRPHPIPSPVNTVDLYAKYREEQQFIHGKRVIEWVKAREKKNRLIEAAKRSGRLKRAAIKLMGGGPMSKKALYALASKALRREIQQINKQYFADRQAIYNHHQRRSWNDWLQVKAIEGNTEALAALRARASRQALKGNTVAGGTVHNPGQLPGAKPENITRKGTIVYRIGTSAIRDDGDVLQVSRDTADEGLEVALRMAMHRYGERTTVNGSAEFKERIVQTAATARLTIIFDDDALERRRQVLLNTSTTENRNEPSDRRRTDRSHAVSAGPIAISTTGAGRTNAARAASIIAKPNLGKIGTGPPPQAKNRLRNLSQLGVVRIASRGEVLLPGDVFDHMEQQGTQSDHAVRRDVSWAGLTAAQAAVEKYIAEREDKRLKGFDILNHRRYNRNDEGPATYAGSRQIEGQSLALLKRGEEMIVLPMDATTARYLKRLAIGAAVIVTPQGSIKAKGRSR